MLRQVASFAARRAGVRKLAVSTPLVRDLAWRFVAGEDLAAGLSAVRALNARGIRATLNHVGTHVRDEREAVASADACLAALQGMRAAGVESNLSVKLTQIGLDVDEALCRAQLRRVLDRASALGAFVRIDMEESAYTERTLRLFEEAEDAYGSGTVGIVLQSYLRHRRGDLARLVARGARIRLVKGGYWEPASAAYRRRSEIDAAFLEDVELLVSRGVRPAIATHDPRAIARAREVARGAGIPPSGLELQMLYGVREDLQRDLAREGHPVRSYVPYGARWYEYVLGCVRRVPGGALRRLGERLRPRGPGRSVGAPS